MIFGAITLVWRWSRPFLLPPPAARADRARSFKLPLPHRLEIWGFMLGFAGDGVFLLTLAFLMKDSITIGGAGAGDGDPAGAALDGRNHHRPARRLDRRPLRRAARSRSPTA